MSIFIFKLALPYLTWSLVIPKCHVDKREVQNYWAVRIGLVFKYVEFLQTIFFVLPQVNWREFLVVFLGPLLGYKEFL